MKNSPVLLIGIMLITLWIASSAMAAPALQVQVNEKVVTFDVSPFISDGEVTIPVRHLSEAIGARVEWDAKLRTVWIHGNMMHVEIPVGKREFYIHRDADFSGIPQTVKLKAPVRIINGRTFLPALAFTDNIGLAASWDKVTNTLSVQTDEETLKVKVEWGIMNLTTVKSMELYSIDREKLRDCSESEMNTVIEALKQSTIDDSFYIAMIAGRVLKISLNDGRNITFHSYGSKTNVVAAFNTGDATETYHLAAPPIAELLLLDD